MPDVVDPSTALRMTTTHAHRSFGHGTQEETGDELVGRVRRGGLHAERMA